MTIIKMADGREFDAATKKFVGVVDDVGDLPEGEISPVSSVSMVRKNLRMEDLPADKQQMNVINATLMYDIIGMPLMEICYALGCTIEQLETIRNSSAYEQTRDRAFSAFQEAMNHEARTIISKESIRAAKTLAATLTSKSERNRIAAADSLLDRAGISDRHLNNDMGSALIIKIVQDKPTTLNIQVNK